MRRRKHLRSLSDVTPASRAAPARARSHSERPPPLRASHSARTSPDASRDRLDDPPPDARARTRDRLRGDTVGVVGDPWRKMSELDLRAAGGRARPAAHVSPDGPRPGDPWIKNRTVRPTADRAPAGDAAAADAKREATVRRGKLERKSAVVCDSCGNESCECWRPRSPACPRTPRAARSLAPGAAGALCTCSPRLSPSRLAPRQPVRALSDDEGRPRRLRKTSSQKMICSSVESESVTKTADPLLETTC